MFEKGIEARLFSGPGKKRELFWAWTILVGQPPKKKGKKGATEQLRKHHQAILLLSLDCGTWAAVRSFGSGSDPNAIPVCMAVGQKWVPKMESWQMEPKIKTWGPFPDGKRW